MTTTTPTPALADLDLDKLEALAQMAAPGPWMRLFGERTVYDRMSDGCRGNTIVRADTSFSSVDAANLDFIAAANPAAVLHLIALARRAAQPAEGAGQVGQVAKLADALNTMLWLYRRLPGAYGKPPFVDAALIDLAAIAGVGGVPEAIKERATLLDATHQPSAQVKP